MKYLSFFTNQFKSPTIAEICDNDIRTERKIVEMCDQQITHALFQKALSNAKIKALEDWISTTASSSSTNSTKGSP